MPTPASRPESAQLCVRHRLVHDGRFVVDDVRCGVGRSGWTPPAQTRGYALKLMRSGCFIRRANGVETILDAAVGVFVGPGEEQQFAHPADGGDRCTVIGLDPMFLASLWGGDPDALPQVVFLTSPLDLAHRRLLASLDAEPAAAEVEERIANLGAATLAQSDSRRVASGRPTNAARRRLVDDARQLLASDPTRTLLELARELAVSPHHLSRIFSAATGVSVTTYRNRLRVRAALERIGEGERSLTRVAADLGFTDHAHLTRTIARETGLPPSTHRETLVRRLH